MTVAGDRADRFRALHRPDEPLLIPNPWDVGSARLLGVARLSGAGHDQQRLRRDAGPARRLGHARRRRSAHAAQIVVGDRAAGLGRPRERLCRQPRGRRRDGARSGRGRARRVLDRGLLRAPARPDLRAAQAAERVRAAAEVAHAGPARLVLTARAENHLHGRDDLDDTIARLQAYQEAGADVLYAPGPTSAEIIGAIVSSVDLPGQRAGPRRFADRCAELAQLGVSRISVGGSFAFAAIDALVARRSRTARAGHLRLRRALGGRACRPRARPSVSGRSWFTIPPVCAATGAEY